MTQPGPPTGIIDFFTRPPLGVLSMTLDENGPYTGNLTLTSWGQGPGPVITQRPVSQSYGVMVQIAGLIPPTWGFTSGWVSDDGLYDESDYFPPLGQLVAQHRLASGQWVTTNKEIVSSFPTTTFWNTAFPGRIGIRTAPRISFDLFYVYLV